MKQLFDQVGLVRYNRSTMDVTVQQAKSQLSQLLRKVEAGESVTILRGPDPVAMLVKAPPTPGERQIWGDLKGSIGPEFDKPLEEFSSRCF